MKLHYNVASWRWPLSSLLKSGRSVPKLGHYVNLHEQIKQLLKNQLWDFDETSYVTSWHWPLSSLLKYGRSGLLLGH